MSGRETTCPPVDPGTLNDFAETHQSDLRRIDDAENAFHPLLSQTCDRDRRVTQFGTPKRARTRPFN
jgi:hypothetical protein